MTEYSFAAIVIFGSQIQGLIKYVACNGFMQYKDSVDKFHITVMLPINIYIWQIKNKFLLHHLYAHYAWPIFYWKDAFFVLIQLLWFYLFSVYMSVLCKNRCSCVAVLRITHNLVDNICLNKKKNLKIMWSRILMFPYIITL